MNVKKSLLTLLTIVLFSTFTACSDNDGPTAEPEPTPTPTPTPEPTPEDETNKTFKNGSLFGTIIGTKYSVDYNNNSTMTETVNTKDNVFDGNFDTYFASYERSGTWVGLDLGEKYVINKVGYSPRITMPERVQLAIIEGANKEDFSDAMPILLIKKAGEEYKMSYADVTCSRGFRYVRYMSPYNVRCNLAELAFYGEKGEGDDSQLYQITNLPLVVINTKNAADITSKENEIPSTVYIISEGGTKLLATEETGVRGRGNASWQFPKKPYRLKFDKKQTVLDAPAKAKKWTLINNYGDKTLMRNMVAFEISKRIGMAYTPYCHPVDVVLNGEYKGCYQLCDQIEVNKNRVNITEMEASDVSGTALTGGYLIEVDGYADTEASHFDSNTGIPVTIKSPDDDEIVSAQSEYIKDYFNRMEAAVFADNFENETEGYRKYLDLDSFLRYILIEELCGNPDALWSIYISKEREKEQFCIGPVWDFDIAFDNDNRCYPVNNKEEFLCLTSSGAGGKISDLARRILHDDAVARQRLSELWKKAGSEQSITKTSLLQFIDETAELLKESQTLNFKRWDILNQMVHQNPQAAGSYEAEVSLLKKFLEERFPKMDSFINQ